MTEFWASEVHKNDQVVLRKAGYGSRAYQGQDRVLMREPIFLFLGDLSGWCV